MKNLDTFQQHIGYTFNNPEWLEAALTHGSIRGKGNHFERLEFLGDKVLGFVMSDWLYDQFPDAREGELSKKLSTLVCKEACESVAIRAGIDKRLQMTTPQNMKNSAVLSDATEALIGAIYSDSGMEQAAEFIFRFWEPLLDGQEELVQDYKSFLQEWAQAQKKGLPTYESRERSGPDHEPIYKVELTVEGFEPVLGQGSSKKQAEQEAAKAFVNGIVKGQK